MSGEARAKVTKRLRVILAAKTPLAIQLTLEPEEGTQGRPMPLPKSEEERQAQKMMEGLQRAMPAFAPPFTPFIPTTILMLDQEEYDRIGRPRPGDLLEIEVNEVA